MILPTSLSKLKSEIKNGKKFEYIFFWGGPFSQWYMSNFVINGIQYNCAEQYMMAEKARIFNDMKALQKIMKTKWPKLQKEIGRSIKNYNDEIWSKIRKKIVYKGNIAKFNQNPKLLATLLKTKNKIIVEASPEDIIWGIGLRPGHPLRNDPFMWRGENLLGFVLMKVRNNLI